MSELAFPLPDTSPQGGPYSANDVAKFLKIILGTFGAQGNGVVYSVGSDLEAAINGTNIAVSAGYAVIEGFPYINTTPVVVTQDPPLVGDTARRIVIRVDWDDHPDTGPESIKATILTGTDGSTTPPALTQDFGTIYEIPIAKFEISTIGEVTNLVDEREYISPNVTPEIHIRATGTIDGSGVLTGAATFGVESVGEPTSDSGTYYIDITFNGPVRMAFGFSNTGSYTVTTEEQLAWNKLRLRVNNSTFSGFSFVAF